jgi:quinol monooxygenase YgiN
MSVVVLVDLNVKADRVDDLISYIAGVIDGTRAYDGCELMTMVVNQDDPSNVLFVERWETRAKYEAYLAWRTETGSMENLVGMLAGDPVIRFFDDTGV